MPKRDNKDARYKLVSKTRKEVDEALKNVPDAEYAYCNDSEKESYDKLSVALQRHRAACRQWRGETTEPHFHP